MSKKLSFEDFNEAVKSRTLPVDKIGDYAQLDPESPIPIIIFKPDALTDKAPEEYDLDNEIYILTQYYKEEELNKRDQFSTLRLRGSKVVAEGDSWFNLPPLFFPTAIADRIYWNGSHDIKNIARWGHTIKDILNSNQHLRVIKNHQPSYFLLSAGGNDLQLGLASLEYLHPYEPSRPLGDYLTTQGKQGLEEIANDYRTLLDQVTLQFPNLKILVYGYDYPRPLVKGGKFIGRFLRRQGFPNAVMDDVIRPVMKNLNKKIENVSQEFNSVNYINCLGATDNFTWYDDMHPGSDAFIVLTDIFEEHIV